MDSCAALDLCDPTIPEGGQGNLGKSESVLCHYRLWSLAAVCVWQRCRHAQFRWLLATWPGFRSMWTVHKPVRMLKSKEDVRLFVSTILSSCIINITINSCLNKTPGSADWQYIYMNMIIWKVFLFQEKHSLKFSQFEISDLNTQKVKINAHFNFYWTTQNNCNFFWRKYPFQARDWH